MALVAAWHFDEASGNALDVSGNGRHITTITRTTGYNGSGARLATIATLTGGTMGPFETAQRSFTFWARPAATVYGMRWQVDSLTSAAWGFGWYSGQTMLQSRGDNGLVRAFGAPPDGTSWYHYAGTYDGANIRLYINRSLVATQAQTGLLLAADRLEILSEGSTNWSTDNLRIYDTAIDQAQINRDYATPPGQPGWSRWNGSSEDPLVLSGAWNGASTDIVEYDTQA